MIVLLLLAAVAAGSFWAGRNSREDRDGVWPWVAGAAVLGILLLGMAAGPIGGPGLFGP